MSASQMSDRQRSLCQMSVSQMSLGQMSVDQLFFEQETWSWFAENRKVPSINKALRGRPLAANKLVHSLLCNKSSQKAPAYPRYLLTYGQLVCTLKSLFLKFCNWLNRSLWKMLTIVTIFTFYSETSSSIFTTPHFLRNLLIDPLS